MPPINNLAAFGALSLILAAPAAAFADSDYARDAITAIAPGRHQAFPTGTCTVWANAEGLGVGPGELDGLHGVAFSINEHPVAGEGGALSFDTGLAVARKSQPKAPAWLFTAIEKNRAAIQAACARDSQTPILIRKLTGKDKS